MADPRHFPFFGIALSPGDLSRRLKSGDRLLVLDLRSNRTRARDGRIPGAIPTSPAVIRALAAAPGPEQALVLVCSRGIRSRILAPLARGRRPVYSLAGGVKAWKEQGLTVMADQPCPRPRP